MNDTVPRVAGHGLAAEGKPHDLNRARLHGNRFGRALCACGDLSPNPLTSDAQRRDWHREHKAEVLASQRPRLSEADWQRRVMDYARLKGWRVVHIRAARTAQGWRTAYEGDPGLPDLILARRGEVLLAELKTDKGKLTDEQTLWLAALGINGRCWRPKDWERVQWELA